MWYIALSEPTINLLLLYLPSPYLFIAGISFIHGLLQAVERLLALKYINYTDLSRYIYVSTHVSTCVGGGW